MKVYRRLHCLNCSKNTESENSKVARTKNESIMLYQNVYCVTVKNPNLSNSKKLAD